MTSSLDRLPFLAALLILAAGAGGACSSDCPGRIVDGQCQERCRDALCSTGYHCFENACRAPCVLDSDCAEGQRCRRVSNEEAWEGKLCLGGDPLRKDTGPCTENADCNVAYGYACIEGACRLTCEVHEHCGSTGACTATKEDASSKSVRVCEPDGFPRGSGEYGAPCPYGTECAEGFECIGAGPGDANAYCTLRGCGDDEQCPTGFFCSTQREARPPCEEACGFAGRDARDCVPDAEIGPGRAFECGRASLTYRVCLKRGFCNACETDADCLGRPNQVCAKDRSGEKACTVLCDRSVNSCPWGSAAVCGLWDEELGKETCAHRFGRCTGDGSGCHPCLDDDDCPRGLCQENRFTGERFCVDLEANCDCPEGTAVSCSGGGCPLTPAPASQPMACFGGTELAGSVFENTCVGAIGAGTAGEHFGCWPSL